MKELNITWEGVHDDTGFFIFFCEITLLRCEKKPMAGICGRYYSNKRICFSDVGIR